MERRTQGARETRDKLTALDDTSVYASQKADSGRQPHCLSAQCEHDKQAAVLSSEHMHHQGIWTWRGHELASTTSTSTTEGFNSGSMLHIMLLSKLLTFQSVRTARGRRGQARA